jgi:hypothetical protein
MQDQTLSSTRVSSTDSFEKYLGLLALIGRSRVKASKSLQGRIWDCIIGWKKRFLTHVGKEILLKVVVQAIPTYTMSVFQLPKTLCKNINSMMQQFWWGHKENLSKVAWMSWERLALDRWKGGLGYRDLVCFNQALLAKQGWRLVQYLDSLVVRVMKAKYYPHGDFMDSSLGGHPSYAWRSIWAAKKLL